MGFMDAYKRLEKLCKDALQDEKGVSAYLELMEKTPRGAAKVENWEADYKQLKHYRWMRNKIAHDPEHTEETMCKSADEKWLKDFYKRIMEQTDPLALYRKATVRKKPTPKPKPQQPYVENRTVAQYAAAPEKKNGCIWFLIAGALAIAALVLAQIFLK
jgi:hypothetical protein